MHSTPWWIAVAAWSATSASLGAQATATVEISIQTREGIPLPGATLTIAARGGSRVFTVDSLGRATIRDAEPGVLRMRARYIGFKEGDLSATIGTGRNTVPIILDEVDAPRLDTVRVVGSREVLARHQDVEDRRRLGLSTRTITREEMEKRNAPEAWHVLTNAPSVKIVEQGLKVHAVSSRGCQIKVRGDGDFTCVPCVMRVMVDEILMQEEEFDLAQLPRPNEIYAIEVFGGPAQIPAKYVGIGAGKWCGLISVWTR